jgi:cell wall-associated NlpC family hydrolase
MCRLVLLAACAALLLAPSAGSRPAARSWAQKEIRLVVEHGLMAPNVTSFRPNAPLTQRALADLVAGLTGQERPAAVANAGAPATIARLDARLVRGLELGEAATAFGREARRVGLNPPARFGTEVVARLLELRANHPAGEDALELSPSETATRAEAAYSAAQILRFRGWEIQAAADAAASFELPQLSGWQKRILGTAVRFIGFPYVWGGESENVASPFGAQVHGGFDCSGFVWRVFKLQRYPGAGSLAQTLSGRTTFAMSGEVAPKRRIRFARLAPADVLFFGARGPRSRPAQIDHMGINLGGGWMIHSSRQGVFLSPLQNWYRERFAWGRRPLAEAGLIPA